MTGSVTTNGVVGSPYTMKNRIINGAMMIDQRNAGAAITQTTSLLYGADRWFTYGSVASKFTAQQQTSVVPAGFTYATKITSSSAYTVGASEYFLFGQRIEGYNIADLGWGTANAKTITLSFWVYSSLTGTFGGQLENSNGTRSYPFSYTISSANTWEQKTVTITGDTTGSWAGTTSTGIQVCFSLGSGSTVSGTSGSWSSTEYFSATGATSVVGTNGATFYITGVQLEVGSTATAFEWRPYGMELQLCQRYYELMPMTSFTGAAGGTLISLTAKFSVQKRTDATIAVAKGSGTDFNLFRPGSELTNTSVNVSANYSDKDSMMIEFGTFTFSNNQAWSGRRGTGQFGASAEL